MHYFLTTRPGCIHGRVTSDPSLSVSLQARRAVQHRRRATERGILRSSAAVPTAQEHVHRALPTLVHHAYIPTMYRLKLPARPSHAMLPPQLSPSTNPVPRIVILPAALSVSHRSPQSRVSVLATGNATHYPHLPCPAALASTANPTCLRGARSCVPPSICPRRTILSPRRRSDVQPQGEEGGGKMGPGRMRNRISGITYSCLGLFTSRSTMTGWQTACSRRSPWMYIRFQHLIINIAPH
jgi:hypothetical protein